MTLESGCCLEGRHSGLCCWYCWCQTSLALRCFFWDVSYYLHSLPGAHRARGDSVQLEAEILPVEFSDHLWMVLPFRALATANVFWSFLDPWRKCFCFRTTEEGGDSSEQPRGGDTSSSLQQQRGHKTSPYLPHQISRNAEIRQVFPGRRTV